MIGQGKGKGWECDLGHQRSGRETCLAIIVGLPTDQKFQHCRLNLTALMRPTQGVAFPCCPSPSEWAFFLPCSDHS